ncbi:hypothetical protein [Deferrisoma palaeochoriense]
MGGPAPDRTPVADPGAARRLAKAQIAVGVPALLVVVAGVFLAWQMKGGMAAAVAAGFLVPVVAVFGAYFWLAWRRLRRGGEAGEGGAPPVPGASGQEAEDRGGSDICPLNSDP